MTYTLLVKLGLNKKIKWLTLSKMTNATNNFWVGSAELVFQEEVVFE
jgi:hypothetical protein